MKNCLLEYIYWICCGYVAIKSSSYTMHLQELPHDVFATILGKCSSHHIFCVFLCSHAKDVHWQQETNIHFIECVLGDGEVDFVTWLTRLATLPHDVPLMVEHMRDQAEYLRCRDHLIKVAAESKIALE